MSRKNIWTFVLILTISIVLLAISEGVCDINSYYNNLYNNPMYPLTLPSGLTSTLNYPIGAQLSINLFLGLVNQFNNNPFNNEINYAGNYQMNYPGGWSFYAGNLFSGSNASNYPLGGLNTFNHGWDLNDPTNFSTNSLGNQYVFPNFSNISPVKSQSTTSYKILSPQPARKKIDDWRYDREESTGSVYPYSSTGGTISYGGGVGLYGGYSGYSNLAYSYAAPLYTSGLGTGSASYNSSSYIGYSTGGAKDVNNFRENIQNDYLPIPTDITYEGLFYDYFFDTGQQEECPEKFCPSYSSAVTKEPFSEEDEFFLSVGLNSGIRKEDFQRKKLNLVIVLDISGSMGSRFNQYYYDQFGNQQFIGEEDSGKAKITIATEAIVDLLDHLRDEDRFGMVLFESVAYLAKPLRLVGDTDMAAIKQHILELEDKGSTNMEAGMNVATEMFDEFLDVDPSVYENRIIFLTDAMPNTGQTSDTSLLGMTKSNADNMIFSTFIGIGVDFNTELVEFITKIRGANYYSVHSSIQFKEQMDEGFEYMVTPLLFNLELILDAQGYEIEKVYGSPEADEATGELMKVNTLFPTKTDETGTKGGMVLLKLKKISDDTQLTLTVSYEDRGKNEYQNSKVIPFEEHEPEYFENTGIKKAVLLSRYANLMKNWITDERKSLEDEEPPGHTIIYDFGPPCIYFPCLVPPCGCFWPTCPHPITVELGEWERQSVSLNVSEEYKQLFAEFKDYFEVEMAAIADNTLQQEIGILETLSTYGE